MGRGGGRLFGEGEEDQKNNNTKVRKGTKEKGEGRNKKTKNDAMDNTR